jgi:drug/metabolite transporter (DMT)-like permease
MATIAFLWFVGVVRGRLGDSEPRLFGTVFLGSSVLLAVLLFTGAALLSAPAVLLAVGERTPDPDVVSVTRAAAAVVLSVFTPRVATLVMFSTASLGRATGALPKWLVWATYVVGVVEFVNVSIATPIVYVMPAWIALVSCVLLLRRPPHGFELETPAEPKPA